MDNIREINGGLHVKMGKTWQFKSNFVFEVLHQVSNKREAVYIVKLTRSDGVSGEASFKTSDLNNSKKFHVAINSSFKHGGLMCFLSRRHLVPLIGKLARQARPQEEHDRKQLVLTPGLQDDGVHVVFNPYQIIDIITATMVNPDRCVYVWPDQNGADIELQHRIITPPDIQMLKEFLTKSSTIFDNNFGPAILAWSSMYAMTLYKKFLKEIGHFNLPVLHGLPGVGKTLIAQCGAWLVGCTNLHFMGRCTYAFLTDLDYMAGSSLPFVWDHTTKSKEVDDVANGHSFGTGSVKKLLTGCLVTANFDVSKLSKSFKQLVVFPLDTLNREKQPGEGIHVQDMARNASSALPVVMSALNSIKLEDIEQEVARLPDINGDNRVQVGIAVPILVARIMLNLCGCNLFMSDVDQYVQEKLIPYYRDVLPQNP
ncbi:uncharacterized protein LOC143043309 [Mytilus galloprovincialis]|uniref:uncharacterized protein LOC143043309 n=1 Tax=Mytilus galloprovincialis TaxID=29158 RepID=UPI003F7C8E0C